MTVERGHHGIGPDADPEIGPGNDGIEDDEERPEEKENRLDLAAVRTFSLFAVGGMESIVLLAAMLPEVIGDVGPADHGDDGIIPEPHVPAKHGSPYR
jgi:hypothetical protein